MGKIPVGLQLYTVREAIEQDFEGTLRKVAKMGYAGVEFAGVYGKDIAKTRELLDELGIKTAGLHLSLMDLENELPKFVEIARTLGTTNLIVCSMPEELRADKPGWLSTAERMNKVGENLNKEGMQLLYHNHSFEFEKFEGEYGYDIFFGAMNPDLVKNEIDVFWVKYGGLDPAEYIQKYSKRMGIVHLKDMSKGTDPTYTEVGEGILNLDEISKAAEESTATWYVVEQDTCQRPPLESAEISINNLKAKGIA